MRNFYREFQCNFQYYVNFYTPDFSMHLDIDIKNKRFTIRDTLSNQVLYEVPKSLMEYDDSKLNVELVNRLRFLDNEQIRILSTQGVEKIVDFKNGFITVAENTIPLFQEVDIKEGFKNYPYYYERMSYKTNETQKWLTRKYQQYKS